jgi:hypothetical protein
LVDDHVVSRVSDAIYSHIRHYADEAGYINLDITEFQQPDFRGVDGNARRFIESLAEEVLSALTGSHMRMEQNASRFLLLPLDLREFLESQPSEMLSLYKKMNEAIIARKVLGDLILLMDEWCPGSGSHCNKTCFCFKAKLLVRDSSLRASSGRIY